MYFSFRFCQSCFSLPTQVLLSDSTLPSSVASGPSSAATSNGAAQSKPSSLTNLKMKVAVSAYRLIQDSPRLAATFRGRKSRCTANPYQSDCLSQDHDDQEAVDMSRPILLDLTDRRSAAASAVKSSTAQRILRNLAASSSPLKSSGTKP